MFEPKITEDYWRIWYYLLEGAGLNVQLVNPSHARQLAGRPKTDRLDAQWIARLAEMGLLRPSFVPPPEIRALRDLTRTRLQLVRDRTREWQRLEKLLEGALVKLSSAVHSLAKTKTARDILEALAAGERNPKTLAALASAGVKGGRAAVEQALDGMMPGGHHPRLIRIHLDHITFLDRSVAAIEDEIEAALDAIPAARGISADGVPSADPGPGAAALAAADRLAEIPGVSRKLAMAVIAETGLDMTRFPTADHLVSWAGLAPVARQSGPRNRKPKKGKGDAYLKGYCTQAATGAARTDTFLGERIRRLSRRLGGNRAKCAVAAPSSSSSGTCSPTPKPGSPTSAPTGTSARPTATARSDPPPPAPGPRPRRHHHPSRLKPETPLTGPLPTVRRAVNHARVWLLILTVRGGRETTPRSTSPGGRRLTVIPADATTHANNRSKSVPALNRPARDTRR